MWADSKSVDGTIQEKDSAMLFLVAIDHVKSGQPLSNEAGLALVKQAIFPTLVRAVLIAV